MKKKENCRSTTCIHFFSILSFYSIVATEMRKNTLNSYIKYILTHQPPYKLMRQPDTSKKWWSICNLAYSVIIWGTTFYLKYAQFQYWLSTVVAPSKSTILIAFCWFCWTYQRTYIIAKIYFVQLTIFCLFCCAVRGICSRSGIST